MLSSAGIEYRNRRKCYDIQFIIDMHAQSPHIYTVCSFSFVWIGILPDIFCLVVEFINLVLNHIRLFLMNNCIQTVIDKTREKNISHAIKYLFYILHVCIRFSTIPWQFYLQTNTIANLWKFYGNLACKQSNLRQKSKEQTIIAQPFP